MPCGSRSASSGRSLRKIFDVRKPKPALVNYSRVFLAEQLAARFSHLQVKSRLLFVQLEQREKERERRLRSPSIYMQRSSTGETFESVTYAGSCVCITRECVRARARAFIYRENGSTRGLTAALINCRLATPCSAPLSPNRVNGYKYNRAIVRNAS